MIKKERLAENRDHKISTVAQWKASGLSQAEFCRREGYQQWQLSEWRRWVEKHERQQSETSPIVARPDKGQRRRKERRRKPMQQQIASPTDAAGPQHFVPVRLVEAGAKDNEQYQASEFNCVVELVLKRGETIRVAPHCPPQFLGAVVATLNS